MTILFMLLLIGRVSQGFESGIYGESQGRAVTPWPQKAGKFSQWRSHPRVIWLKPLQIRLATGYPKQRWSVGQELLGLG